MLSIASTLYAQNGNCVATMSTPQSPSSSGESTNAKSSASDKPPPAANVITTAPENKCAQGTTSPHLRLQADDTIQCHHPIHPAYASKYSHSQCPLCRMIRRAFELDCVDRYIDSKCGVGQWRQNFHASTMSKKQYCKEQVIWHNIVRGGSVSRTGNATFDKDGKDMSHRHAKMQLHNLVTEMQMLAEIEARWCRENITGDGELTAGEWQGLSFSAAAALHYYHDRSGAIHRVEKQNAKFSRMRGKEWEISIHPDYPQDVPEPKNAHRSYPTTLGQRAFIKAHSMPLRSEEECMVFPSKSKRRIDAKVSFNSEVHVRKETNIDVLREQGMAASERTYNVWSLDSEPRSRSPRRCHWYRDNSMSIQDSQKVDTSGRRWKGNWAAWEQYVQNLEKNWKGLEDDSVVLQEQRANTTVTMVILGVDAVLMVFIAMLWHSQNSWVLQKCHSCYLLCSTESGLPIPDLRHVCNHCSLALCRSSLLRTSDREGHEKSCNESALLLLHPASYYSRYNLRHEQLKAHS